MNRTRLTKILVHTLVVIFCGCFAAARPAGAAEKVDLRLKPAKGDVYKLEATLDQKMTQQAQGQQQTINQTIILAYSFTIDTVDAQGNAVIKVSYDHVRYKQSSPQVGSVEYDSENPPATIHPLVKGFAALSGQGFTMTLSPSGKVSNIKGLEVMIDAILKKFDLPEGPMRTQVERQLRTQFGEQSLKDSMENMLAVYPEHPVAIGDSWHHKITLTRGFPLVIDNVFTLKGVADGVATLDVQSKLQTNPDAAPTEMGAAKITYSLKGDQSGNFQLDLANGWVKGAELTQKVAGDMKIDAGGGQSMTVPTTTETTMKIERK